MLLWGAVNHGLYELDRFMVMGEKPSQDGSLYGLNAASFNGLTGRLGGSLGNDQVCQWRKVREQMSSLGV